MNCRWGGMFYRCTSVIKLLKSGLQIKKTRFKWHSDLYLGVSTSFYFVHINIMLLIRTKQLICLWGCHLEKNIADLWWGMCNVNLREKPMLKVESSLEAKWCSNSLHPFKLCYLKPGDSLFGCEGVYCLSHESIFQPTSIKHCVDR